MTRKFYLLPLVLLVAALIATPAQAKSYHAERFDVLLNVQPDGLLLVTETVEFQFEGGSYSYAFREIELAKSDGVTFLDASMDGTPMLPGSEAGQVEVEKNDRLKVTWHFAPTSDAAHTFVIRYQVSGAIRSGDADTLIWRAIPKGHEYSIAHSTIRIEYPTGVTPLNAPTLEGVSAELEAGSRAAVFTARDIDDDTPVNVSIQFAPGSLVQQPPAWQVQQEQNDRQVMIALPFGLSAAALTGIVGLIGVFLLGRGFRRETTSGLVANPNFTAPPKPIAPALAARLTGSSTTFLGTLFDLARRGVLRMEEGPQKWGSRTFEVIRQPANSNGERLLPHEQAFLDDLFHKGQKDRAALSAVASFAYSTRFTAALDQELLHAGWRDAERVARRNRFLALWGAALLLGGMLVCAGIILGALGWVTASWATTLGAVLIGAGVAAGGVGLIGLLVGAFVSPLSDEGLRQVSAWNSFSGHLHNIIRGRAAATPELFELYLPYAAGFGIATEWAKSFKQMTGILVPDWFQGLQAGIDDGSFIAIMAAISMADSSASAATGGDGGASGGGASGAG